MHVSMDQSTRKLLIILLILQFSILITRSATFSTKVDEDVTHPSIKCGECPCVNPCSQQPPTPPPRSPLPPIQYISPPPPRFVYVTGVTPPPPPPLPPIQYISPPPPRFVYVTGVAPPPPPPRFGYMTGHPGNLYGSDPYNWQSYSNAPLVSLNISMFVLVVVLSALRLLVV